MTKEHRILYPSFLIAEEKTLKVYVDNEEEVTFVPFPSHYCAHPGQFEHLKNIRGEPSLIKECKEYGRHDQPMDAEDDYILEAIQDD